MRAGVSFSKEEPSPWGIPASLLLHALLVVALLFSPAAPKLMQVPDTGVAVEILTPQQFHAAVDPKPQPVAPLQPEAQYRLYRKAPRFRMQPNRNPHQA